MRFIRKLNLALLLGHLYNIPIEFGVPMKLEG